MKTLHRKLLRDLWRSKWLLLTITGIIAVGITGFVGMRSVYFNLRDAQRIYYAQCRMADFWIDLKKAPRAELHELAAGDGIGELQPRIVFQATIDLPEVPRPINALVVSLPDRRSPPVNGIVLQSGGYFTDQRPNEVIVTAAFAKAHRLRPGQRLFVLLNNRRQELQIVGVGISSEFTYMLAPGEIVPDPRGFGVLYLKDSFAEDVFDFQAAANQVVGRFAGGTAASQAEWLRRAESRLESFGVLNVTPLRLQASNQFLSNEIAGLGAFATIMPTVFLAVAAVVLNVLINRLARQQRTVVGTLKALGYGDAAVFVHFLSFGLTVGVLGGLLGCGLGYMAATGMTYVYRFFFEFPRLPSEFHFSMHLTGMAISVFCAALGSLHGARAMWKLQAAAAMRPEPPRTARTVWIERWLGRSWQRLSSSWRMALRSLIRARFRTAAGVFAAMMGAGLLCNGFMMVQAQNFMIDFQFARLVRSDFELSFESEQNEAALDETRRLPGVDRAEPLLQVACTLVHGPYRRKGGVTGIAPDATLTVPCDVHGRPIDVPDAGLVITRRLAEILHLSPGDRLTVIPVKGRREPIEMAVARVADSYLGLAVYADIRYLSRAIGEEFSLTGVQLQTSGDASDRLQFYRTVKQMPGVMAVSARRDTVENLRQAILKTQWIFIACLIGFSGILFFGSILNASMVNLAERQREVATLLALGYSRWQVGGLFLRESLLTNFIGTLAGMPFGYFLTALTAVFYDNDLIRLPVVTGTWIWITTFWLAVVFALLAHAAVQWRIHTLAFAETLKVKE